MDRRTWCLSLVALALPSAARADIAPLRPPQLDVRARASTHRGSGSPREARVTLVNRSAGDMRVRVAGAVALLPGMRLPLSLESVRIAGADGAEARIAGGGQAEVEVRFAAFEQAGPPPSSWSIEVRVDVLEHSDGLPGTVTGTTTVRRA